MRKQYTVLHVLRFIYSISLNIISMSYKIKRCLFREDYNFGAKSQKNKPLESKYKEQECHSSGTFFSTFYPPFANMLF